MREEFPSLGAGILRPNCACLRFLPSSLNVPRHLSILFFERKLVKRIRSSILRKGDCWDPNLAKNGGQNWPVRENHCFQRIVLDTICSGVWYAYLDRPAYKNLTHEQAQRAVDLCHEIASGRADLKQLNNQSLIWRGKSRVRT